MKSLRVAAALVMGWALLPGCAKDSAAGETKKEDPPAANEPAPAKVEEEEANAEQPAAKPGDPAPLGVKILGPEGRATGLEIDFAVATSQRVLVYCRMGSTRLALSEVSKDTVELKVSGELEMGEKQATTYIVPRSLGVRTFKNASTGLDFAAIEEYRKK
ncbi:MAG: hypothetical protein K8T20_14800 [Planctomycetes bacterium]|nr:hypothetical protein [Planctomycetota bacterium]